MGKMLYLKEEITEGKSTDHYQAPNSTAQLLSKTVLEASKLKADRSLLNRKQVEQDFTKTFQRKNAFCTLSEKLPLNLLLNTRELLEYILYFQTY